MQQYVANTSEIDPTLKPGEFTGRSRNGKGWFKRARLEAEYITQEGKLAWTPVAGGTFVPWQMATFRRNRRLASLRKNARLVVQTNPTMRFRNDRDRMTLADYVARIINPAGLHGTGLPYTPVAEDTRRWVLDRMSDWELVFDEEHQCRFHINHRGNDHHAVEALTRWVAYRYCLGNQVLTVEVEHG